MTNTEFCVTHLAYVCMFLYFVAKSQTHRKSESEKNDRRHSVHLFSNIFSSGSLYLKFHMETKYVKVRDLEHFEEALGVRALPA